MKTTVYEVVSSSYESADNYLHQESFLFYDKDKAREKFECLKESIKGDVFGNGDIEYNADEDEYENCYEASREVGTEFEYQAKVELNELTKTVLPDVEEIHGKKKYVAYFIFGEDAVDAYDGIPEELEDCLEDGCGEILRKEFDTEAELRAYQQGLEDMDGWRAVCCMAEEDYEPYSKVIGKFA